MVIFDLSAMFTSTYLRIAMPQATQLSHTVTQPASQLINLYLLDEYSLEYKINKETMSTSSKRDSKTRYLKTIRHIRTLVREWQKCSKLSYI